MKKKTIKPNLEITPLTYRERVDTWTNVFRSLCILHSGNKSISEVITWTNKLVLSLNDVKKYRKQYENESTN